ncbi:MAG TPA: amidohydrolase [Nitrososphaerales archaeon]|nr:amidohydrolase [Nitrososphaerales archaeon]
MTGVLIRGCSIGGREPYAVYCQGGKVLKIVEGSMATPDGAEVIDANGGSLYPGFVDSHCHPFEFGWLKRSVDLRGTANMTAVRLRLVSGVQRAKPGEWVSGMGWDQEAFPGKAMPNRAQIDDISPGNPVVLSRVCGHTALVNSRGIETMGFTDRVGEEYERDENGSLTGIVKERALDEVYKRLPRSSERSAADLQSVEAEAGRFGLTTLHCILSPDGFQEELEALAALGATGSLSLKYRVYIPPEALDYVNSTEIGKKLQGAFIRINGVKIYADGSLGARTAALREPYADERPNAGILRYSDEQLSELVQAVDSKEMQVIIHAIGDRAVEQAAEALGTVAGGDNPLRHRIEHASLLPRDIRSKMARHSIRATVQPLFITSDSWGVDRLGEERARDLYPLRSMLAEGIVTSGSSDSPIESMSPILGMWAAMTRGGADSNEKLTLEQALSLYTANARTNGLDAAESVSEGSIADLTLLDSETSSMHPALLRKVGVLATVVDGMVVHSYGTA